MLSSDDPNKRIYFSPIKMYLLHSSYWYSFLARKTRHDNVKVSHYIIKNPIIQDAIKTATVTAMIIIVRMLVLLFLLSIAFYFINVNMGFIFTC